MKIGLKLTLAFFLIAILSISVVGYLSYDKGRDSLERESFNRLTAVREMKSTQIEDYFQQIRDQIRTFSSNPTVVTAMKELKENFFALNMQQDKEQIDSALLSYMEKEYVKRLNPNIEKEVLPEDDMSYVLQARAAQFLYMVSNPNAVGEKHKLDDAGDGSAYSQTHAEFHPVFRQYLERFGYYDIFLVDDSSGHIVYTVFKEVDFGTSLLQGPFRSTNLADAFRSVRESDHDTVQLVDFKTYHPSYGAPASFIAAPIYDGKKRVGVLVFQMPIQRINNIMTSNQKWADVGLGSSGETYIVGEDFTLRNESRFLIEDKKNYLKMIRSIGMPKDVVERIRNFNSAIGLQEVKTKGTKAALAGKTGEQIFKDYRGVPVLSSYKPLNIKGMNWVIMSEIDEEEAFAEVTALRKLILWVFAGMLVFILVISYFMSHALTVPLKKLTGYARMLSKGNMDVNIDVIRKDEIGVLSVSFRKMQASVKRLVEDLQEINHGLEDKVKERTAEIHRQKEMVEEKNKEIVDSINYAKRLQSAIIPPEEKIREKFEDSFVLFKPKDIVSGDFYWMDVKGHTVLLAVADCTGHGVPGAMVSVVGANSLNRCVKEFGLKRPAAILDKLRDLIVETFEMANHDVKDGMDISLFAIDKEKGKVQWAGANNPLWILRKDADVIEEIKADKQPIGKFDHGKPFHQHEIDVEPGDCLYIFSDGFADQFGGEKGKKFKASTMRGLFQEMKGVDMQTQKQKMDEAFETWRGSLEQIDDVCVMGIRM